jgi:Rrf2 family transcriptional regulator, iron-sulfur cluster assembly transcription factor
MKLNKKVELGINAVNALRKYENPVRTQDLAVEIGTTQHFLEQIMRNLRTANIVVSIRGPGGGYKLNGSFGATNTITAYDVAKAVGRDFGILSLDQAPMNRLSKALTEAFLNTVL